ncbi:hypothetical protein [Actinoplanes regularis]|uniref:Uncharacterized protein n=1 Tax=Actinoplanes regularis TaxID=52697 RepID=A0A238XK60_9ACTN|nr:hypothetical protein [Actinoplanes regularis]GIE90497.1 hypothetical protein Are01nite_69770 [Actinoplanes regularis]SNR58724.1 hypothetical protein SAMN06264365_103489 [Actinoplanes regularis]
MTRCTQTEAFAAFRKLRDANAGRLRGQSLTYTRYGRNAPIPAGTLHPEPAAQLHAAIYHPAGQPVTAAGIVYVVSCDGTPIAWLCRDARVVTPAAELSAYQLKQQTRAAEALSQLTRQARLKLAAFGDKQDGRIQDAPGKHDGPHLLVADPAAPTVTWWTRISTDLENSRAHLRRITRAPAEVLIMDAVGYGDYQAAEALVLDVLCTIEEIAQRTGVPADIVGSWLHTEGGTTHTVSGQQVIDAFLASYAGIHANQRAFAVAERDARGWTGLLHAAGISLSLFDLTEFAQQLFDTDAYGIALPDHRIAVFRRPAAAGRGGDR